MGNKQTSDEQQQKENFSNTFQIYGYALIYRNRDLSMIFFLFTQVNE